LVILALFQHGRQSAQYFLGFKTTVYGAVTSLPARICHSFHYSQSMSNQHRKYKSEPDLQF